MNDHNLYILISFLLYVFHIYFNKYINYLFIQSIFYLNTLFIPFFIIYSIVILFSIKRINNNKINIIINLSQQLIK